MFLNPPALGWSSPTFGAAQRIVDIPMACTGAIHELFTETLARDQVTAFIQGSWEMTIARLTSENETNKPSKRLTLWL